MQLRQAPTAACRPADRCLRPGPIGAVTAAVTRERLSEQCDVTFILDPASAEAGYRVRAAYVDHGNPGEGEGETLHADLGNVEFLRISGYGACAQQGLAAALRAAADLLDAAGGRRRWTGPPGTLSPRPLPPCYHVDVATVKKQTQVRLEEDVLAAGKAAAAARRLDFNKYVERLIIEDTTGARAAGMAAAQRLIDEHGTFLDDLERQLGVPYAEPLPGAAA
ncbi:hypothetical protein [Streptomyces mirabilis]|uniref:hypothetical protein n=1 Tax=Streptomyces mirabilis TaxID=68239 RepID=UPI002253FD89|nr:hypothetical protein [Streptomyces mirabilis]MCX4428983.1 hypothetical protein [Streptomyces mirabilis]